MGGWHLFSWRLCLTLLLMLGTTGIFEEHSGVACTNAEESIFCVEVSVHVAASSLILALIAYVESKRNRVRAYVHKLTISQTHTLLPSMSKYWLCIAALIALVDISIGLSWLTLVFFSMLKCCKCPFIPLCYSKQEYPPFIPLCYSKQTEFIVLHCNWNFNY